MRENIINRGPNAPLILRLSKLPIEAAIKINLFVEYDDSLREKL
jgi:hypothetical protein